MQEIQGRNWIPGYCVQLPVVREAWNPLIGKLQFLAKCIQSLAEIFIGRLIAMDYESMDRGHTNTPIPVEARKDIAWWSRFSCQYNGVSLLWLIKEPTLDTVIQTDACPKGFGGVCGSEYYRSRFPKEVQGKNITILEMWAVMIGLKIWKKQLAGKYFWIQVDNEAVASCLNTGRAREPELQNTLREIALIVAEQQFVIKAKHIPGVENRVPDWLSRWGEPQARASFREYAKDSGLKQVRISNSLLKYTHQW